MEGRPPRGPNLAGERETIMVTMSATMKEALDTYAGTMNESRSHVVRKAIAQLVGITMEDEPVPGRPRKYASKEERKAVQKERNKLRRKLTSELLAARDEAERQRVVEELTRSLEELDNA